MNLQILPLDAKQHKLFVICIPLYTHPPVLFQYIQNLQRSNNNHIYHLPQTYKKLDDIASELVLDYWILFPRITIVFDDPHSLYFKYSNLILHKMKPYYYAEQQILFWNIKTDEFYSE